MIMISLTSSSSKVVMSGGNKAAISTGNNSQQSEKLSNKSAFCNLAIRTTPQLAVDVGER
jgi:hypothetical protein